MSNIKKCGLCKQSKSTSDFYKRADLKYGVNYICKSCQKIKSRNYGQTKIGLIKKIYSRQITSSKTRGHNPPEYSLEILKDFILNNKDFEKLFSNWKSSNYNKEYTPSIDRIDPLIGYKLNNIQLISWRDNRQKYIDSVLKAGKSKRNLKIIQLSKEGKFIKQFPSITQAQKSLGILGVSRVKDRSDRSAGGFKWITLNQ